MDFISRNGFFAEDKGSHSVKVQVLPVSFFSAASTSSAQMPELHCSMAAGETGEVGGKAVTLLSITEQEETQTQLAAFIF